MLSENGCQKSTAVIPKPGWIVKRPLCIITNNHTHFRQLLSLKIGTKKDFFTALLN
jgi:hypothetical protein